MSNIYKIKTSEIEDFISYNNTNKLIMFYRQDCLSCKLQIEDINKLSDLYKNNIEYAICDIQGKNKFCINNNIIHVPTIHLYKNNQLVKQIESKQKYDLLEKDINNLIDL